MMNSRAPGTLLLFLAAAFVFSAMPPLLAQEAKSPSDRGTPQADAETPSPAPRSGEIRAVESKPGLGRYRFLMVGLTIFLLALFVGFEVIAKVPPTLHTPLMSGSNAISGITVVGSIIAASSMVTASASSPDTDFWRWLASAAGMIAVALAMINVVGGFWVTHRMLGMFRGKSG